MDDLNSLGGGGGDTGAINTGNESAGESQGESTEQAIARVEVSLKKAAQIGAQIQSTQKINTKIAQFLTFLIQNIPQESIRNHFENFIILHRDDTKSTLVQEFVAFFLPFYLPEVHELDLGELYAELDFRLDPLNLSTYSDYIQRLYNSAPKLAEISQEKLLDFVITLNTYFGLLQKETLNEEQFMQIKETIRKEIFSLDQNTNQV